MMGKIAILLEILLNIALVYSCPERCLCYRTTVRCMFLQLDTIPTVSPTTTVLDLRFNQIREIPPQIFRDLVHLDTLLLNDNHIVELHDEAFDGLAELRFLYLYKNEIQSISSKAFHGLSKLEQLYLHHNKLETLEVGTFHKLPTLERLFLHNNKLQQLPSGIFSELSQLRRIRLDGNALVCDCGLLWLADMLREREEQTQAAVTCDSPLAMAGKSLVSLHQDDFYCKMPEILEEPNSVEVSFGSTVYFTCRADGNPQPDIVWYHNNEMVVTNVLDPRSRYSVLDDGTLMIASVQEADMGGYECMASNIIGQTKAPLASLRQKSTSAGRHTTTTTTATTTTAVIQPTSVSIEAGEVLALECSVAATDHDVIWTRDGGVLTEQARIIVTESGALMVKEVGEEDSGAYMCVATGEEGTAQSDIITVTVQGRPIITRRPSDEKVVEGDTVTFTCAAKGSPTPVITWRRNGRVLPEVFRYIMTPDRTSLTIQRVRRADEGSFDCHAENSVGSVEAGARLVILALSLPEFVETPSDIEVPLGLNGELVCRVTAVPEASIQWLKDDRALTSSHKHTLTADGALIVHDVSRTDEGLYECVAENSLGTARASARLSVLGRRVGVINQDVINRVVSSTSREVDRVINSTREELLDRSRPRTPEQLLQLFRYPEPQALQLARAAEIFERTLELLHEEVEGGQMYNVTHSTEMDYEQVLSRQQIQVVASLSGCTGHRTVVDCSDTCFHLRYRTLDGTCNNLQHPMWGASLTPVRRLLPAQYDNNFNTPQGWTAGKKYNGHFLPSARTVSTEIISAHNITPDERHTHMLMQWGQFQDHDLDFMPMAVGNARFSDGRHCNDTCDNQSPCFPIMVPPGDPRIRRHRCIGVTRSSAICGSGTTSVLFRKPYQREQLNQLTAYMDASNIYGSSDEAARNLRDFSNSQGLMRIGFILQNGKPLLPGAVGEHEAMDCQIDPNAAHVPCFLAGDHRANEQLGLLAMHTIWVREHNRLATELLRLNQHWDADTIYHEARKIVGAQLQHITYEHWLPEIIGAYGMKMLGPYRGYNASIDAGILNEFATAVFRFGHTLINPVLFRLNETMQPSRHGDLPLHKAFFAPWRLVEEGGVDPLMRGLYGRAAKKPIPSQLLNSELTEKLFALAHEVALDLASLNIQRGRDHGLPSYNHYRRLCGLRYADTFDDMSREIQSAQARRKLETVYKHPDNVDLFVGGILEDVIEGAKVGPTFMCIMVEQFRRVRDGDRLWYENEGVFTANQLREIRQTSLARVICDNGDNIRHIQRNVFLNARYPEDFVSCDLIPRINTQVWASCCSDCQSSSGQRHSQRGRRSTDYRNQDSTSKQTNRKQSLVEKPEIPYNAVVDQQTTSDGRQLNIDMYGRQANNDMYAKQANKQGRAREEGDASGNEVLVHIHTMMDVVDSRIEGVEEVMGEMQTTIQRLSRQVRDLQAAIQGHTTDKSTPAPATKPDIKPKKTVDNSKKASG